MRYTPALKLSTRLVSFVTMIVISAMFILFVGATLSFQRLGQEYLNHHLSSVANVVDKELADPDAAFTIARWLPKMLQASGIVEVTLSSKQGVLYRYKDTQLDLPVDQLYRTTIPLVRNPQYQMKFTAVPPYFGFSYSFEALMSITLAVLLVIFCLLRGLQWLKQQMYGSELLEERGRMLLAGRVEQYAKGDEREWPYTASEALDRLIEELQDARQERSRFDTFIRTQTFLDKLTGSANRVLFDTKLESALQESGGRGAVMLVRIEEWPQVQEHNAREVSDQFLIEVGQLLSNLLQRYPDAVFSRYLASDFAVLLPQVTNKEMAALASQCVRQLERLTPLAPLDGGNWCHIGLTTYSEGERQSTIMEEAETALRSAQLQDNNNWSRFRKIAAYDDARGSVKWRSIFELALKKNRLLIYEQACFQLEHGKPTLLHRELTCRMPDPEQGVIKASRYMLALRQVGFEKQLDRAVFAQFIEYFKQHSDRVTSYSLNLSVTPFAKRSHFKWLRDELLQLTCEQRALLSIEFSENLLVRHLDYMRPVVRMIRGLGCQVIVGQAGRTIVSTYYLKDLHIDYLKLHRSLIKKIEQRHENQLFIRSMLGAGKGTNVKVIAVGVETESEWQMLQELGVDGAQGRFFATEQAFLPPPAPEPNVHIGRRNRWRKK